MGRVTILPALICLVWLAQPPGAVAQTTPRALARPSLTAPSAQIGIIGGRFTRLSPQVLDIAPQAPHMGRPSLSMAARSGRRGALRQGNQRAAAPIRLGMIPSPSQGSLFRQGLLSDFDIGATSGFATSVSPETPLYGWPGLNMLPGQDAPLQEVKPAGSAYHQFFDLTPSPPPSGDATETYSNLLDMAEKRNQTRLQDLYNEAFKVFAEATADRSASGDLVTEEQKLTRLRQAAQLLGAARDLTKVGQTSTTSASTDLPILDVLEAHVHLERNRGWSNYVDEALGCLVRAARDDPDTFHRLAQARHNPGGDRPIAAYFGDYQDGRSSVLERQMLQYVRVATVAVPTLDSLMVQAYCAWVLDDKVRASRALDEAERTLRERPADQTSADWNALIAALRYAL
jgi:hypothetical protein